MKKNLMTTKAPNRPSPSIRLSERLRLSLSLASTHFFAYIMKSRLALLLILLLVCSATAQQATPIPVPAPHATPTTAQQTSPLVPPAIISALISALVSVSVIGVSRWIFSRNDRRFPILVLIQTELLKLMADPPWDANGGFVDFKRIPETAKRLQPLFDQLSLVSWPVRNCPVQKAFKRFTDIRERQWKSDHPKREKYDIMQKEEFLDEIKPMLDSIKNA